MVIASRQAAAVVMIVFLIIVCYLLPLKQ